ncbi:MAG: NADH:ubiquinone reductase (Na(+)-transporting) subunit D [Planctomycetota bacterium]|jgi:Na+-transporting NADH:ubiquinone oxidoreductase subunit D
MTATVDAPAVEEKKPLFGRGEKRAILDPMWDDNPIALQVLGICSALAVTVKLDKSLVMCGAVVFVLCMSNVIISVLRRWIPNKIRIIVMLTVISTLVTLVSLFLEAYLFELSKALSVFVGLIVTNCIVMGRAEAYAMANPPWRSFLDGLGNALGYSWILIAVAVVRELFGSGELMGLRLIPRAWYADQGGWYVDNGLMVLAPGAFILLGIIVWVQRAISGYSEQY